jgi:hypothetical protein
MESREVLGKKNAPRNTDRVKENNSPQVSVKNIFENGADPYGKSKKFSV